MISRSILRCLFALGTLAAAVTPSALQGQSGLTVAPRVVQSVDDSAITRLDGNTPFLVSQAIDQGQVSASTQMTHIQLLLARSPEQEAALAAHEADLENKASPGYHKWMTPQQFGLLYGPADSDVAAITAWLESHGLTLERVSAGRTTVFFSGTAGQLEEAFHTQIHSYIAGQRQFYSNTTDPSIPSALAPVVKGIVHLNTIRPVAQNVKSRPGMLDRETKRLVPATADGVAARPNLTIIDGNGNPFLYIVAGDAATIYDTPNSFNANFSSGTSYNGAGVTIGVIGDAPINASTVANYRSLFLGDNVAPTITKVDNVTDTGDTDEAYIDTELAGALAPGAAIHFYTATNLGYSIDQALTDNTIDIMSVSFGYCELGLTTSGNMQLSGFWQQAYNQGIPVTISTGDTGSASCDAGDDPTTSDTASFGLSVSGWASTPYNVAVGGTDLDGLNTAFSTYASTSQGTSATHFRTALGYIPESTWNDSTQIDTTISANKPWSSIANGATISAGSGGASDCSKNSYSGSGPLNKSACTSGYAKPTWQRGTGVPNDHVRDIPDISLMSGNGYDPATWLICTDDVVTNTAFTDNCGAQTDGNVYFTGFGGTSTAAPAFAGILALLTQKTGARLGLVADGLYDLYNGAHASAIFHDTTVGNNSVACTSGTPNCSKNGAGYYFMTGFDATAGYDLATGLGSVDATQLINFWGSAVGSAAATVTVTPSLTSLAPSQSLTVDATVAGGLGTPTGTVTLTSGSYSSGAQTLTSGGFSFTVPPGSLAVGTDTLKVTYSGDPLYASATGTATVTVAEVGSYTIAAAPATITKGTSGTSAITATGTGGYIGPNTVTLSACTLATSPTGAADSPTCTLTSKTVTFASGSASGSGGTVTIGTTAASSSARRAMVVDRSPASPWAGGIGAITAAGLLLLIPGRLRKWRALLGAFVLIATLGVLSGCGGGGGGPKTPPNPGTTAGTYTFTITGADAGNVQTRATLTVTVN